MNETVGSAQTTIERLRAALRPDRLARTGLRGPLGAMFTGPWLDRPTLWGIAEVYLPLSRLWAAALSADGSDDAVDAFVATVPLPREIGAANRRHIARVLQRVERARERAVAADDEWRRAFFGRDRRTPPVLAGVERRRIRAAQTLMMQRFRFVWLYLRYAVPAVRFEVTPPAEVDAVYGAALAKPWTPFVPPKAMPVVTESRRMTTDIGVDYWLRFPSPSPRIEGDVWARVHEREGTGDAPTFIFGNGIGVEFDQLDYGIDDFVALARSGVRVIEVEAPWHGRRRPPRYYSGEPFLARAPLGAIDLLTAQAQEFAVLIDWARGRGSRRVGIGGASMGALSSLMVAAHGGHWPAKLRPDMVSLITFTHRLSRLPFDSALARRTGLTEALVGAGWTPEELARFRGLTDPGERLAIPGDRLIAVLGALDEVTPITGVREQVEAWGVPEANTFLHRGGHFSTPMGIVRDRGPLERIEALLMD